MLVQNGQLGRFVFRKELCKIWNPTYFEETSDVNLATQSEKFGHPCSIEENSVEAQKNRKERADEVHLVMYCWRETDIT